MILSTNVSAAPLVVMASLAEAWLALNILLLWRAWREMRARGWDSDLCERCLLFGMPVDLWVIRHREELMMTPLYSHARLEFDNYRDLLRHRGRRWPIVWHFVPVALLAAAIVWAIAAFPR
jgi:hypothetical protein